MIVPISDAAMVRYGVSATPMVVAVEFKFALKVVSATGWKGWFGWKPVTQSNTQRGLSKVQIVEEG